jgi:hypothetical protein
MWVTPNHCHWDIWCDLYVNEKVVLWTEDRVVDRAWLLENIPGATGVLVMITDKVGL